MQQTKQVKKQRVKKRAIRKAKPVAGPSMPPKDPYERKIVSYPIEGVGVAYNVDVSHRFDALPPRILNGKEIVRYSGRMPIGTIVASSISSVGGPCLLPFNLGTATEVVHLNPAYMVSANTPENRVFTSYTKYRYTKLRVMYQGLRQANTDGAVTLGYYNDGALADGDMSTINSIYTPGSFITNLWNPIKQADQTSYLTGGDWYYIDFDNNLTSVDADWRLSFQGALFGVWYILPDNLPPIGTLITYGTFWLEYEIELASPRFAFDIVISQRSRPFVEKLISTFKEKERKKKDARFKVLEEHERALPDLNQALSESLDQSPLPEKRAPIVGLERKKRSS